MTENSLVNALTLSGFFLVSKALSPIVPWHWKDRGAWVATAPLTTTMPRPTLLPDPRVTEHEQRLRTVHQKPNPAT